MNTALTQHTIDELDEYMSYRMREAVSGHMNDNNNDQWKRRLTCWLFNR